MTTYQSLYRKYRSQTFSDLVGQEATSRALQGAIIGDRVSHAYLFSGSRGTGKTSAARLLAKALNCSGRAASSAEPCNKCTFCLEVGTGSALDLIEIDAASNRGIDEIRDLREKVNLAPAIGPKKVYIIDEAHMLTEPAFNALLKTLEEPPPHVVFVMCTTDAQKIPLTVIGRCQQFVFRRHTDEQITSRLAHIAHSEKVEVDEDALELIARTAQGSMRDAIGLLDQLVPLASGAINIDQARSLLGIADPRFLDGLLDHVLAGRASEAIAELSTVYAAGAELRQVVRGLMEGTRDRLLAALTRRDQATARQLSGVLDALLHLDGEVRRHAEPRFLVEATLARLAVESISTSAAAAAPAISATASSPVGEVAAARNAPASGGSDTPAGAELDAVEDVEVAAPVSNGGDVSGWAGVLEKLNRTVRAAYLDAQPEVNGSTLVLSFKYAFHYKKAQADSAQVMPHLRTWLGDGVKVEYRLKETEPVKGGPKGANPEDDPLVQAVVKKLEGRITRVREVRE